MEKLYTATAALPRGLSHEEHRARVNRELARTRTGDYIPPIKSELSADDELAALFVIKAKLAAARAIALRIKRKVDAAAEPSQIQRESAYIEARSRWGR